SPPRKRRAGSVLPIRQPATWWRESPPPPIDRAPPATRWPLPFPLSSFRPPLSRLRRRFVFDAAGIEDRVGHFMQRILLHHRAALEGAARHAVNERRRLVLSERHRLGVAQFQHSVRAVLAHAGQDH